MRERKPRLLLDDDQPFVPNLTVYEPEQTLIDTGLVDVNGQKLFRRPERQQIGFDLSRKVR